MVGVAELRGKQTLHYEWVIFIEGIDVAFTAGNELVGAGVSEWISTTYGAREIKPGLILPKSITVQSDFMSGKLKDTTVKFSIRDIDGSVCDLFKTVRSDEDVLELGERLPPTTTTAPATLLDPSLQNNVTVRDRHIGLEYIGPSGQRRHFWVAPSDVPAGLDHPAPRTKGEDISYPRVSTEPIEWSGRKVALYKMLYDPVTDTWPNWLQQHQNGAMRWYGTMRGSGNVKGRVWTFDCWGPMSWLRKPLGQHRRETLPEIQPGVQLRDEEKGLALWFFTQQYDSDGGITVTGFNSYVTYHDGDGDGLAFTTEATADALRNHVQDAIENVRAGTNTNVLDTADAWTDVDGRHAVMTADRVMSVSIPNLGGDIRGWGAMGICLHEKVWLALGYEPKAQRALAGDDPAYIQFMRVDAFENGSHPVHDAGEDFTPPGPGYWYAVLSTIPPGLTGELQDWGKLDNNGSLRPWRPLWKGGTVILDHRVGQKLKFGYDAIYLEGQNGWQPREGSLVNGNQTDRVALVAFVGQILRADGSGEPTLEDYAQVMRISWRNNDGAIGSDADGRGTAIVDRLEDPRIYGWDHEAMTAPWVWPAEEPPTIYVLNLIAGFVHAGPDYRHMCLTRLFLSSGTMAVWDADEEIPDVGINQPEGMDPDDIDIDYEDVGSKFWGGDLERQDWGCNIPPAYLDFESVVQEAMNLPGGVEDPLNRWRMAWIGSFQSQDLFESLLSGAGWAWSWIPQSDGPPKFGLFTPWKNVSALDVDAEMLDANKAGDPKDPSSYEPDQDLRIALPVDRFKITYRYSPEEAATRGSKEFKSLDKGKRHRMGNVYYRGEDKGIEDVGLSDPNLFRKGKDADFYFWNRRSVPGGFRPRFQRHAASYLAGRHFKLTLVTKDGEDWGPGTTLRITDPRPANPNGTYGLEVHVARVYAATYHLKGELAGATTVRCVAQERGPTVIKLWAPHARVWGYNETDSTLTLKGNYWSDGKWLDHGAERSDALGWVKEDWMSGSGNALVYLWQSRDGGDTWPTSLRVELEITNQDTNTHKVTYTNKSGTIYPDTDKLLLPRPYADQGSSSWLRTHYMVVTLDDGTHGAAVAGSKLQ